MFIEALFMIAGAWSEVFQSCPTLCNPMDCSLQGSSAHGIFQASVLECVAISFSRGSSRPRDQTWVSRIVGRHFTVWATREASQPKCQSTDEWTLKMWYIHNGILLSHIRNEIGSFVIWGRCEWTQSLSYRSKKEKNKYRILTHVCEI